MKNEPLENKQTIKSISSLINPIWHRHELLENTVLLSATFAHPLDSYQLNNNQLNDKKELLDSYGFELPHTLQNATDKRQQEFVAGRICACQALLELDAIAHIPMINEDGSPRWATGYIGSITHTHNKNTVRDTANTDIITTLKVASIVTRQDDYLGIGLDMEPLIIKKNLSSLSEKILTANELQRFSKAMADDMSFIVTLIFSLKESLFKALYPIVGRRFYLQDAEVISIDRSGFDKSCSDKKNGTARLRLTSNLNEDWQEGSECEAVFECIEDDVLTVVFIRV